jgi:hypothetical protein
MALTCFAETAALKSLPRRFSDARLVGAHEVQAKAILALARYQNLAEMADACGRLLVEGGDGLPTACILPKVFDAVENPANPVPAERFDCLEPWPSKSRIRDEDGLTAIGEDGLQSLEELAVSFGGVVVLQRIDFFVD